ncbi:MAG: thymidylate kinase, partial [Clostridiales bacterium]|nr:thymidylate kinase [Clostridiales bacterium]
NAIHQAAKLIGSEQDAYLRWLYDFEYHLLGLPVPDAVLFLDMPPLYELELLRNRKGKTEDIHESDESYLEKCYETALKVCESWKWTRISCVKNGTIRTIEDIEKEILKLTKQLLGGNLPNA